MQKYHDEPKQYKGYLKSALAHAVVRPQDPVVVLQVDIGVLTDETGEALPFIVGARMQIGRIQRWPRRYACVGGG